ncbi:MAG: tetratricopeptide repeat protein [Pseudomonadota bacterium]
MKRALTAFAAALIGGAAMAAVDLDGLWNFKDPAATEVRFRAALAGAQGDDALILRTQIARTLGLRGRFDEAHRELDAIEPALVTAGAEPRVRAQLERGRTLRSAGKSAQARPLFERAFVTADGAGLERLAADALHMVALAEPALDERIAWNRKTIAYAERAKDPRARGWRAAALNNIGSDQREAGRLADSLDNFRDALAAYQQIGGIDAIRVARWQVANVLRLLGRREEALAMQLALASEHAAGGAPDPYVFDELALLEPARAADWQAKAEQARRAAPR